MDLFALKDQLNLRQVEGGTVGELDSYYFSVFMSNRTYLNFTFNESLNASLLRKFMKQYRYGVMLKTFIKKQDSISILVPNKIKDLDKYLLILKRLVEAFKLNFLRQYTNCFYCNKENAKLTVRNDFTIYNHDECVKDYNLMIDSGTEQGSKAYLPLSITLAIIGAVIGLIPNIITIFAFNLLIGYLFALIPLASYFGYKIGGAPQGKFSITLIVIVSVISVLLMNYWLYAIMAFDLGLNSISDGFSIPEFLSAFMKDTLFSLLFVGIGVMISWRIITNANKPKRI